MAAAVVPLVAALPIVTILVLMLGFRASAARAGVVGLVVTLLAAWFVFGYGTSVLADLGVALATLGALGEAVFIAATILWIIFPALCIHELQLRTGQVDVLRLAMGRLSRDPRIIALLVAWFFVLFVEGAAGFGTSVALAAPFLVSAGFKRVEAVAIALIGHSVGVSFGAVGTPILPQIAVTGFAGVELSAATAAYHGTLGWIMPLVAMTLVARAFHGGPRGIWGWTLLAAALFLVPHTLIAMFVGPELPTMGGALVGGLLFVVALAFVRKWRAEHEGDAQADSQQPVELLQASAPYLVLIGLVLVSRLIPAVREVLSDAALAWQYGEVFGASFEIFYHPGTLLLVSFAIGALWQRAAAEDARVAIAAALKQLLPVTVALVAMLGLSRVMVYAGMIDSLATSAAALAGGFWPLLAPFVGTLGTFVTGSATASNILFTEFQQATATALNLPVLAIVGAQGFGAAVGNIICPHNIIAAGATVRLSGKEGQVLRRTLWPALLYSALGGLLAYFVFT